jgi:hypothetical protein
VRTRPHRAREICRVYHADQAALYAILECGRFRKAPAYLMVAWLMLFKHRLCAYMHLMASHWPVAGAELRALKARECSSDMTHPQTHGTKMKIWYVCFVLAWCAVQLCDAVVIGDLAKEAQGKPPKVAIIGGGVGGAVAAYMLSNSTSAHIVLFEATNHVGGRMHEATLQDGTVVELGGSIGIAANRYFVHFSDMLGLKRVPPMSSAETVGIWDGTKFVVVMNGSLWSKLALLARCAHCLFAMHAQ